MGWRVSAVVVSSTPASCRRTACGAPIAALRSDKAPAFEPLEAIEPIALGAAFIHASVKHASVHE